MRRVMAGLLLALTLCHATGARAACTVSERGSVPVERAGPLAIVPVMLNGQQARFLLDTGAERTVVTTEAARRLGLARDEWVATTMRAANGALERNRNAIPSSITLGGVALRHRSIARDSNLVVTTPTILPGRNFDGLLGRDFLVSFDLWLDLPAGLLRLYEVTGCAGRFLPWSEPYLSLPVTDAGPLSEGADRHNASSGRKPEGTAIILRAEVNGVPLRALLDTGASQSLIAAPGIYRLGLTPNPSDAQVRIGMSAAAQPLDARVRHFEALRVGPEVNRNVAMLVAPVRLVPTVDMILGADWFSVRSVWISFSTGRVFMAAQ